MTVPTFRKDINALRAYAVLAVMFFHFGVPGFSGGFVGVDVFFVISGYLMTKIIMEKIDRPGRYWQTLLDFYLARARRILPALVVLCAVLLALGWFTLPSMDYKQLGIHAFAALLFLSNFKFWREASYFDLASHDKWLLHTWSLSVEWQFYLLFPLLVILVWRFFPKRSAIGIALILGFVASLALSITFTKNYPSAAFYLLPTRAWELFAGGLVCIYASKVSLSNRAARLIEFTGFGLILFSVFVYSAETLWPHAYALVPVLGAVLILLAARQTSFATRAQPIQTLGNWSYSVYLWHWPVVVALVWLELAGQRPAIAPGIITSLALGWLSYTYVEKPTRQNLSKHRLLFSTAVLGSAVVMVAAPAFAIWQANGVIGRLSPEVDRIAAEAQNFNPRQAECHGHGGYEFKQCVYGGKEIRAILVGDSHASAVASAVAAALPSQNDGLLTFTYTSCPTIFGVKKHDRADLKCAEFNDWMWQQIKKIPDRVPLIVVNRASSYVFSSNSPREVGYGKPSVYFDEPVDMPTVEFQAQFSEQLAKSACRLTKIRPTYLVRPFPEMQEDIPKIAARRTLIGNFRQMQVSLSEYHARHALVWVAQDIAVARCGTKVLNPLPFLCEEGLCLGTKQNQPLYYDSHHLSEFGNKQLVPMFKTVFD